MKRTILPVLLIIGIAGCAAQQQAEQPVTAPGENRYTLDGSPYTPGVDANIDLYLSSWKDSEAYYIHRNLIERDILTKGDPMDPPEKGAVLKYTNRFTYATVASRQTTASINLDGEQFVILVASGEGVLSSGGESIPLYSGLAALIPDGTRFTMRNTGGQELAMYLISEPVPDGFTPREAILVTDENVEPIRSSGGHWAHIVKELFVKDDGLATLYSVFTVGHAPMTIGHPHSHDPGCEEVWTAIKGETLAFLGKQVRKQPVGTAYNIPPDSKTPHCNINTGSEMSKHLYFSVRKDIDGTGI